MQILNLDKMQKIDKAFIVFLSGYWARPDSDINEETRFFNRAVLSSRLPKIETWELKMSISDGLPGDEDGSCPVLFKEPAISCKISFSSLISRPTFSAKVYLEKVNSKRWMVPKERAIAGKNVHIICRMGTRSGLHSIALVVRRQELWRLFVIFAELDVKVGESTLKLDLLTFQIVQALLQLVSKTLCKNCLVVELGNLRARN